MPRCYKFIRKFESVDKLVVQGRVWEIDYWKLIAFCCGVCAGVLRGGRAKKLQEIQNILLGVRAGI